MHLVHHQQRAVAAELGQMQVGRGGDALIGGDVAVQAAARVRRIVGGADADGVTQRGAPGRVGERLLGLQAQAVARHHPADALDDPGGEQGVGGDHRQQRLAAARRHRSQDIGDLRRLAGRDGANDGGDLGLMGAQRAGSLGQGIDGLPAGGRESESFCGAGESTNALR